MRSNFAYTWARVGLCHNLWKKDWSALQINANSHGLTHLRRFITTLCHWEEEPVHATSTYLTQASVKWQFPLGVFAHFPTRQCEVERPVATAREMSEQWSRRPVINECFGLCPSFNAVQLCLEKKGYDLLQSLGVCTEKKSTKFVFGAKLGSFLIHSSGWWVSSSCKSHPTKKMISSWSAINQQVFFNSWGSPNFMLQDACIMLAGLIDFPCPVTRSTHLRPDKIIIRVALTHYSENNPRGKIGHWQFFF